MNKSRQGTVTHLIGEMTTLDHPSFSIVEDAGFYNYGACLSYTIPAHTILFRDIPPPSLFRAVDNFGIVFLHLLHRMVSRGDVLQKDPMLHNN